ncbi:MAG: NAD(P)H-binding protein [Pseudanabaenaceae cyanobacterium SKYGB_i_bin29]|nr:NAD(P)H-binding protein [Pseudanabaenaceae cyanobacterium SKYG29]MDW8421424.1 NAD(P)H-binding protein [Pseudanabaenaceae cyanobacterium SKYGB_i_bin29]
MNLLVVGATGTLGRQVVRYALDQGLQVKCLVRNPKRATFLREWGAELVVGDLTQKETIEKALTGITHVVDAATTRPTDSLRIKEVDWQGKVHLIQAAERAEVAKFVFFSILHAEKYRQVPLMEIKYCTEQFLAETNLDYTILKPCGFMQGLIGQYAIPILEGETIWITGESCPIAYMNTQDVAKFAVKALTIPETKRQSYALAGVKAWCPSEIVALCEKLSGKTARTAGMPIGLLRFVRKLALAFEWTWSVAERMAFVEVMAGGIPIDAPMADTCDLFQIPLSDITTLEDYLQDYFSRILRKLRELQYKDPKVKTPF